MRLDCSQRAAASIDEGVDVDGPAFILSFTLVALCVSLPCEVADYVFSDMNNDQRSKVSRRSQQPRSMKSGGFIQAQIASTECDSYVAFDYAENIWTTGDD